MSQIDIENLSPDMIIKLRQALDNQLARLDEITQKRQKILDFAQEQGINTDEIGLKFEDKSSFVQIKSQKEHSGKPKKPKYKPVSAFDRKYYVDNGELFYCKTAITEDKAHAAGHALLTWDELNQVQRETAVELILADNLKTLEKYTERCEEYNAVSDGEKLIPPTADEESAQYRKTHLN